MAFFLIILTIIIALNINETQGVNAILPLLVVYLGAGLRLLPGFVKLNGFLQQVESYKPSLNLIHKELLVPDQELATIKSDKNIDSTINKPTLGIYQSRI